MTLPFRPERLVLAPSFASELAADGRVITSIEHFEDGTARVTLEPEGDEIHADLCECLDCTRERQHWHAWACHDDGQHECPDCTDQSALDHHRARLIGRLKGRMQTLGAVFVDDGATDPSDWRLITPRSGGCEGCGLALLGGCALGTCAREASALLHPYGRCSCGGEGHCSWCKSTCNDCGATPHGGPCPDFDAAELGPACRLCYCSRGATCLVEDPLHPEGPSIDCVMNEQLGACSSCLSEGRINQHLWRRQLLQILRQPRPSAHGL